jgi:menaquinone-dependent protoporphyrinogen oxidase
MTIEILYSTAEGQARRIAERVEAALRADGYATQCESVSGALMGAKPGAVVLIASVHGGKHATAARNFITSNLSLFSRIPSAFMSVSLSAREADRTRARDYVADFVKETGWQPALTATVAGAVRYSGHNFLKKLLIRRIATENGLPTDTSKDHEFTNWDEVASFVDAFEASLPETAVR